MTPYQPEHLPVRDLDLHRIFGPANEANAALAHYDGQLQSLLNPAILLSPLTSQEAVLSSRIEGTQATMEEVLEHEAGREYAGEKQHDIQEILNYRRALMLASRELQDRPIRLPLIRELHRLLMDSVRGENMTPGEFRRDQNWIGPGGCAMEEATFVPPAPEQLEGHLRDLETYLETPDIDPIVQTAIMHAQFELLHPFRDGNGRVGRILVPLFLYASGRLSEPMFYISAYLERHRDEYYDRLTAISRDRDWTGWVEFFIRAITEQARVNTQRVSNIRELFNATRDRIWHNTRSRYTATLVEAMFERPIFRTRHLEESGIPRASVYLLIRQLTQLGLLQTLQEASGRRPAIYAFPDLLRAAEGATPFAQ